MATLYQSTLKKAKFHYPPWQVQLIMAIEDSGLVKIIDTDKHPSFGASVSDLSMGLPFGISDNATYVAAFSFLLYAVYLYFKV